MSQGQFEVGQDAAAFRGQGATGQGQFGGGCPVPRKQLSRNVAIAFHRYSLPFPRPTDPPVAVTLMCDGAALPCRA